LLLAGAGWGALFKAAGQRDDLEDCAEPVRRHPLGVLALILGLLSLAGFPLAPGGIGRWSLLDRAELSQPLANWSVATLVLVLSGAAVSLGTVIALQRCLDVGAKERAGSERGSQEPEDLPERTDAGSNETDADRFEDRAAEDTPPEEREDERVERQARRQRVLGAVLSAGVSLLALWLIGVLYLRPSPWMDLARRLVGGLVFPGD
jgi:formate hydrogenlyase subunit 3/multisubunit Na+/H+ antiporter MnhD subunit